MLVKKKKKKNGKKKMFSSFVFYGACIGTYIYIYIYKSTVEDFVKAQHSF